MKKIVLLSASPKVGEESTSRFLVEMVGNHIEAENCEKTFIDVRQSIKNQRTQEDYATMSKADALIIAFPLYVFCMPGILTRFLQDYKQYLEENKESITVAGLKVYAIVNCGFPEPEINLEAVNVIRSFCQHINAYFRFGVLIGGGGMLIGAKDASFMKKTLRHLNDAFLKIANDIENNDFEKIENICIAMNFPRWLYLFMGDLGWVSIAHKSGLKKQALYRKPYLE